VALLFHHATALARLGRKKHLHCWRPLTLLRSESVKIPSILHQCTLFITDPLGQSVSLLLFEVQCAWLYHRWCTRPLLEFAGPPRIPCTVPVHGTCHARLGVCGLPACWRKQPLYNVAPLPASIRTLKRTTQFELPTPFGRALKVAFLCRLPGWPPFARMCCNSLEDRRRLHLGHPRRAIT
jgi:hypothetical protein